MEEDSPIIRVEVTEVVNKILGGKAPGMDEVTLSFRRL